VAYVARALLWALAADQRLFHNTELGLELLAKLTVHSPLLRAWLAAHAGEWAWAPRWFAANPAPSAAALAWSRTDAGGPRLQRRSGIARPDLSDSRAYLAGLPSSERAARELAAWGEAHLGEWPEGEKPRLQEARLHEPVEVTALFDFGLTPRHLKNSADTLMKYEQDNPQTDTATGLRPLRRQDGLPSPLPRWIRPAAPRSTRWCPTSNRS
jgi:hypothetical protein